MTTKRLKIKTAVISHKVKPQVKAALLAAAQESTRSQANMLEIMILEYCKNNNIDIGELK